MSSTYELALAGRVPASVIELIRWRIGEPSVTVHPDRTLLVGAIADQSAIRALVNLVWDVGAEIMLLRIDPAAPGKGCPA